MSHCNYFVDASLSHLLRKKQCFSDILFSINELSTDIVITFLINLLFSHYIDSKMNETTVDRRGKINIIK